MPERPELGPSPALHAAFYGKTGTPIELTEYRDRFLREMDDARGQFALRALIGRLEAGETVTLLCSSACTDESRCHRAIVRRLASDRTTA